jgi:hypothetical protein
MEPNFYRHGAASFRPYFRGDFMNNQNPKDDIEGTPQQGTRDPKKKQRQLEVHPRNGRERVPNTEDELDCGDERTTSQEKVRVEQGGKGHRGNTN